MIGEKLTVESPSEEAGRRMVREFAEHRTVLENTERQIQPSFESALTLLETVVRTHGKILLFGNGGSAADAQHIAAELLIRYKSDRAAIAAITLTAAPSTVTACGK